MVRVHPDPPDHQHASRKQAGAVAQLGEHLLCKQGVVGSIPISSTSLLGRIASTRRGNEIPDASSFRKPLASGFLPDRLLFNNSEGKAFMKLDESFMDKKG